MYTVRQYQIYLNKILKHEKKPGSAKLFDHVSQ